MIQTQSRLVTTSKSNIKKKNTAGSVLCFRSSLRPLAHESYLQPFCVATSLLVALLALLLEQKSRCTSPPGRRSARRLLQSPDVERFISRGESSIKPSHPAIHLAP